MILQSTTLECDYKHCMRTWVGNIAEIPMSVRARAAGIGWAYVRYVGKDFDYCPEHRESADIQ